MVHGTNNLTAREIQDGRNTPEQIVRRTQATLLNFLVAHRIPGDGCTSETQSGFSEYVSWL